MPENVLAHGLYYKRPLSRVEWEQVPKALLPGASVVLLLNSRVYYRQAAQAEEAGLEVRDCFAIPCKDLARFALLAMMPLESNFVSNASKHGIAGLNIDAARLKVAKEDPNRRPNRQNHDLTTKSHGVSSLHTSKAQTLAYAEGSHNSKGRFPSDFILEHTVKCEYLGVKKIKGHVLKYKTVDVGQGGYQGGFKGRPAGVQLGIGDENGMENVQSWECSEGCPVRGLDAQSGILKAGALGLYESDSAGVTLGRTLTGNTSGTYAATSGGASRFFKNVSSEEELDSYLTDLICPPYLGSRTLLTTLKEGTTVFETHRTLELT